MAENKFAFQMISHFEKTPKVLFEKQFETREAAEKFKDTFVPIMTNLKGKDFGFDKMEFAVNEL